MRLGPLYSCAEICERDGGAPGDPAKRAAARCSLPGFDRQRWDRTAHAGAAFEAETRAEELVALANSQGLDLGFDLDVDGCPWGWTQCRFVQEVSSYTGSRSADSTQRLYSLRLQRRMLRDKKEPRELLDLVREAEAWEDGCFALYAQRLAVAMREARSV